MLVLDCGLRINEGRTLTPPHIDLDNMLVLVHGKGGKDRKVPFSFEMRRILYNHLKATPRRYVFGTTNCSCCPVNRLGRKTARFYDSENLRYYGTWSAIYLARSRS